MFTTTQLKFELVYSENPNEKLIDKKLIRENKIKVPT